MMMNGNRTSDVSMMSDDLITITAGVLYLMNKAGSYG